MRKLVLLFSFSVCMVLFFSGISFCEDYLSGSESSQQESVAATESTDVQSGSEYSAESSKVLLAERTSRDTKFREKSFLSPKKWKGDGTIVGEKDKKVSITAGDTVYTNLGSYEVKEGTRCDVFRKNGRIKHPKTGKLIGYEVRYIGVIEITGNVGLDSSIARVISSREPIIIGDELKIVETEK
ncbi:MAG: hypothetical protein NT145_04225 [Elusimicrobia bacterium]|nr:hypothetical protein [Elusimicrobiota bacterium]